MTSIRPYEAADLDAITRIWREIGWIDDSEANAAGLERFLDGGNAVVGDIDGTAECLVKTSAGRMRYLDADLTATFVMAVTTSRVARRGGLATTLTAQELIHAARDGAQVAALGMFEQGFYDRFGFGTGSYEHRFKFDPSTLRVPVPDRPTVRITFDDAADVHQLTQRAARRHGGFVVDEPGWADAELRFLDKFVGLGLRASDGRLSAVLAGSAVGSDHADVAMFVAETPADALDLLGVIKGLSDQWITVKMVEPPGIQLQDLIDRPLRQRTMAWRETGGAFQTALGWWQMRILDLVSCVRRIRWIGEPLQLVLRLDDPLGPDEDTNLSGDWVMSLGPDPDIERGTAADLPVLSAGISSFSRLWLGVRSATTLSQSTDLGGPESLLESIDRGLVLPRPEPGMYF
ncbi:MAG TPA: GNAT family N-acetyltransferase [Acidimicrobiales bacterium]|nr:GNAT family N-acetyltransferase [Acidimicrobiales bacterium]